MKYVIGFVTVPDKKTAEILSSGLLRARLAACISSIPGVTSEYRWKGRIERSREILLMIKTRKALRKAVTQFIGQHHPYSVPETLFIEIGAGAANYLRWIAASTLADKGTKGSKKEI